MEEERGGPRGGRGGPGGPLSRSCSILSSVAGARQLRKEADRAVTEAYVGRLRESNACFWGWRPGGICGVCRRQYGRRFPESGVVCVHVSVKRGSRKRVFVLEKRVPEGQAVGMRW